MVGGGVQGPRALRAAACLVFLLGAAGGWSAVTLTTSRPDQETVYSPDSDPDCGALSRLADDRLPMNVVRLRASVPGVSPEQVRYSWSVPSPAVGQLAADLDIPAGQETSNVRGLCAEFGNGCILTKETLRFYSRPTILWIAPGCSVLPQDTRRAFGGGRVTIGVKATVGRRRAGASKTRLGFGHRGSVTLYAEQQNGIGKQAVTGSLFTTFGAVYDTTGLPAAKSIVIDDGSVGSATLDPGQCPSGPSCTLLEYKSAGRFIATANVVLADDSLLCDNLTVEVPGVDNEGKLTAIVTPRRAVYAPGDQVNVRLVYTNVSPRRGRDCIALGGPGALICNEDIVVGRTTDSRSMSFDFRHCSVTTGQVCAADAECVPPRCGDCVGNERCLTKAHCSVTLGRLCSHDSDCQLPVCRDCTGGETCTRVLEAQPSCVRIGASIELLNETVTVDNTLPDLARLTATWTATALNDSMSRRASFKYGIRGRKKPLKR